LRRQIANLRLNIGVVLASARMRLITISRYRGQLVIDIFIPIVFASMPILLGRAVAGDQAGAVFAQNTGTTNYVAYLLLGASVFTIVSLAFWHVAYWLRWEMETGTLEALYLTPTSRFWIAAGTALYSMTRSITTAFIAYFLGAWILGADPITGDVGIAFLFILFGLIPLYGMTLLFGSVILKVKESNALVNVMQWGVSLLMGVFFPIAIFPAFLRFISLLFPPTWMTNGVRSALLGMGYFFGKWYLDLAVLWVFLLIAPLFGFLVFSQVENNIRKNEGVGQF
jgi:ABC-2 type transport system permease protein